jgi:hypothetical protein
LRVSFSPSKSPNDYITTATHNRHQQTQQQPPHTFSTMGKGFGEGGKSGGKGKAGEPKKPVTRSAHVAQS